MTIRAVSLDLDDTLWPVKPALLAAEQAIDRYLAAHDADLAARYPLPARAQLLAEVRTAYPEWGHDVSALRRAMLARLLASADQPKRLALEPLWQAYFSARNQVTLYPDSLAALQQLAERYPLVSISNGNADLARMNLAQHFQHRLSAGELGFAKPNPRIFSLAAQRLGLPLAVILHVGDDPKLDVVAGREAGMLVAWLRRDNAPWPSEAGAPPELVFSDLAKLANWLDSHPRTSTAPCMP